MLLIVWQAGMYTGCTSAPDGFLRHAELSCQYCQRLCPGVSAGSARGTIVGFAMDCGKLAIAS